MFLHERTREGVNWHSAVRILAPQPTSILSANLSAPDVKMPAIWVFFGVATCLRITKLKSWPPNSAISTDLLNNSRFLESRVGDRFDVALRGGGYQFKRATKPGSDTRCPQLGEHRAMGQNENQLCRSFARGPVATSAVNPLICLVDRLPESTMNQ